MRARRVAITGLGVLSPLGREVRTFWKALLAGSSGIGPITSFDSGPFRTHRGGEIRKPIKREAAAYCLACARGALADAGLPAGRGDPARAGIALGSTMGEWLKIERALNLGVAGASRRLMEQKASRDYPGRVPARLARALGWRGPNVMIMGACAAGNHALACAFDKIRLGKADLMLAGGVDLFSRSILAGFNRLLSVAPQDCAPFSQGRKGLIPAEGCGMLLLEELESAERRGARVHAEMLGYGMSSDALHVTMPDVDGVARALLACLRNSGLGARDVDYISAHGTGTPANDKTETAAVRRALGARAPHVPISSVKSMLGHSMGAASALEAAVCCLALETGMIPPTINFKAGDPDCDLDYVPHRARKTSPRTALSNAFAFGGSNCVVALGRAGAARRAPELQRTSVVVSGMGLVEEARPEALARRLLPEADLGFIDPPIAYALAAAQRALEDAGLRLPEAGGSTGILLEVSGELKSQFAFQKELVREGPLYVEPRLFPNILANAAASRAAIVFGLKLVTISLASSFPGGEGAVAAAVDYLRAHGKGVLLAGAVGKRACLFVIETLAGARARRARVLAEIADYAESFSARPRLGRAPGCFRLAKALREVRRSGRPLSYAGQGFWGGRISLELRPL